MSSQSTPSPAQAESIKKKGDQGFSLLEVIVAMAILAVSFITLQQLFSGGIKSASLSEQYLKASTLAHSKLNELELANFQLNETSGPLVPPYNWSAEITPYDSPFNNEKYQVQLNKILLTVSWKDHDEEKNIQLASLFIDGQTYPKPDAVLKSLFLGGAGTLSESEAQAAEQAEEASAPEANSSDTTPSQSASSPSSNISGASTGTFNICGAETSGNGIIDGVTIGVP